ncbi:hypothetical protein PGB90_007367 [Kerria lacca]
MLTQEESLFVLPSCPFRASTLRSNFCIGYAYDVLLCRRFRSFRRDSVKIGELFFQ